MCYYNCGKNLEVSIARIKDYQATIPKTEGTWKELLRIQLHQEKRHRAKLDNFHYINCLEHFFGSKPEDTAIDDELYTRWQGTLTQLEQEFLQEEKQSRSFFIRWFAVLKQWYTYLLKPLCSIK